MFSFSESFDCEIECFSYISHHASGFTQRSPGYGASASKGQAAREVPAAAGEGT